MSTVIEIIRNVQVSLKLSLSPLTNANRFEKSRSELVSFQKLGIEFLPKIQPKNSRTKSTATYLQRAPPSADRLIGTIPLLAIAGRE